MPPRTSKSAVSNRASSYWREARAPRYAITLAAPLLVLYELLAAMTSGSDAGAIRNGADVILTNAFVAVAGARGPLLLGAMMVGGGGVLIWRDVKKHGAPVFSRLALMLAEAMALAVATWIVVGSLTQGLLSRLHLLSGPSSLSLPTQLVLSLGAGLYEELLFRVVLVGALLFAFEVLIGWSRRVSALIAVLLSALIFSAFHYVGPLGDTLTIASFTFRALAGVWFSGLYVTRGFGITAWAHALYDVAITVMLG